MGTDDSELVDVAMNLRAAAPIAWEQFLLALDHYADAAATMMLAAQLTMLPVAQGRAQALRSLAHTLANAPALKEAATKRKTP